MKRVTLVATLALMVACTTVSVASAATGPPPGWKKAANLPGYGTLDFVSTKVGFYVAGKTAYKTTNGGTSFKQAGTLASAPQDADFGSATFGAAMIDDLVETGDSAADVGAMANASSVRPALWIHVPKAYVTTDGGKTWVDRSEGLPPVEFNHIIAIAPSHIWMVGESETIAHSGDGGLTWSVQHSSSGSSRFEAVYFRDALHGWASGASFNPEYHSILYSTVDGGLTWTEHSPAAKSKLRSLHFFDNKYGWTGGYEASSIWRSVNGGASWKNVTPSKLRKDYITPWAMTSVSSSRAWIASAKGLWQTTNSGKSWTQYLAKRNVYQAVASGKTRAWAVVTNGSKYELYRWTK